MWKCVHVSENNEIVNKYVFYLAINIDGNNDHIFYFLVSMHYLSCIMQCYHHESLGTYVYAKVGFFSKLHGQEVTTFPIVFNSMITHGNH